MHNSDPFRAVLVYRSGERRHGRPCPEHVLDGSSIRKECEDVKAPRRTVPALGLTALVLGVLVGGWATMSGLAPAAAAPSLARLQQGVTASGVVTLGGGTCFPDAVLVDCAGTVLEQLRGPGGSAYFAPYIGRWVDIGGNRTTCVAGSSYIDVTSLQTAFGPCGSQGTATPGGPPATPTAVGPTATPGGPVPTATPAVAANLALGKPVKVSSAPDPAHPGEHAVDGDPNTWWASMAGHHPYYYAQNRQWIQIDLGAAVSVQTMHMLWGAQRHARGYAIYAWKPEWCGAWCILASTTRGDGDDTAVFPEAVTAQQFMLYLQNPYLMGSHYELKEWEIFGTGTAPIQSTNVAVGKPSLALNQLPGYESGRAFDGDLNTDWRSATGAPVWIYVDLGTATDVNQAIVRWSPGMHATEWSLFAWNGYAWAAFYANRSGTGGDETANFYPLRTRYVMLYAQRGAAPNIGVREFEVYSGGVGGGGGGGATPTPTVPPPPPPPIPLLKDGTWDGAPLGGRLALPPNAFAPAPATEGILRAAPAPLPAPLPLAPDSR
jgi:hypothetical protein